MSKPQLSLSRSPALDVPLRFFLSAPLFGLAAAVLLITQGELAFSYRWSPQTLALTHLIVLGYISMSMQGALLQIASVLFAKQPPFVRNLSRASHLLLSVGTVLLVAGLLRSQAALMLGAAATLGLAFALLIGALVVHLGERRSHSDSSIGVGLALFALGVTVVLGIGLALSYTEGGTGLPRHYTDLHLSWGLLGWVFILVATLAYVVVPMFQLTANYPRWLSSALGLLTLLGLMLLSARVLPAGASFALGGAAIIACAALAFALGTLWLQWRRKKKAADITVWYWQLAMFTLLGAIGVWLAGQLWPSWAQNPGYPLLLGTLFSVGFAMSVINGMFYKIVPFLIWLHLSARVTELKLSRRLTPNIKHMLDQHRANLQLALHLLSVLLAAVAFAGMPRLLLPAAYLFAASNALLFFNLAALLRIHTIHMRAIREALQNDQASAQD